MKSWLKNREVEKLDEKGLQEYDAYIFRKNVESYFHVSCLPSCTQDGWFTFVVTLHTGLGDQDLQPTEGLFPGRQTEGVVGAVGHPETLQASEVGPRRHVTDGTYDGFRHRSVVTLESRVLPQCFSLLFLWLSNKRGKLWIVDKVYP